MAFTLRRGTIRARITSVLTFGADGVHAKQSVRGIVTAGTGSFRGYKGIITGSGTVVDRATGLGPVHATYRFDLKK